jgi:BMFP domain-containing protein YqiC
MPWVCTAWARRNARYGVFGCTVLEPGPTVLRQQWAGASLRQEITMESGSNSSGERFRIDDIVRRLLDSVPPSVRALQADLESNFRAVLRANLSKLDLVARDEFDAQSRLLARTRARLEALEARLAALEKGDGPPAA